MNRFFVAVAIWLFVSVKAEPRTVLGQCVLAHNDNVIFSFPDTQMTILHQPHSHPTHSSFTIYIFRFNVVSEFKPVWLQGNL